MVKIVQALWRNEKLIKVRLKSTQWSRSTNVCVYVRRSLWQLITQSFILAYWGHLCFLQNTLKLAWVAENFKTTWSSLLTSSWAGGSCWQTNRLLISHMGVLAARWNMQHNDFSPTPTLKSKVWHISAKPEARLSVGDTFSFEFKQTVWKWMYVWPRQCFNQKDTINSSLKLERQQRSARWNKHYLDFVWKCCCWRQCNANVPSDH